jgi:hypothetical protein
MADLIYKTAGDLPSQRKILLHGDSGSGKTRIGAMAPSPIIILTEPNGLATIQASNPDAMVVEATDLATVTRVLKDAASGQLTEKLGRKTLVLDSLTELQRMIRDDILATKSGGTFTLQDWGTLTDRTRKLIRMLRNVRMDILAIALSQHENEESTGVRHTTPMFEGRKIPNEIAGYFSAVGYVFKRYKADENNPDTKVVSHEVLFGGPQNILTKTLPGLEAVEVPDMNVWLDKMQSSTGDVFTNGAEVVDPEPTKPTRRRRGRPAANK